MEKKQKNISKSSETEETIEDDDSLKFKQKNRGKKRKRSTSDSSTDIEDLLPENTLEVEKNLHASAVKNNLDDASVKKILKKVVTNDHVLALVKLREEEEDSSTEESNHVPKLTRAKVKELKKVSTGNTPWNLENLELTPIKHIPVKTRPEVKALIAQELPEDEDDDEYHPTHEDVPSDDDQTLESCSDLDSQPRTPATPKLARSSPKLVKDGPFKVPQEITAQTKRKLDLDKEEATIALRTRSKLSLSETPIEHIESSFVPPDELPLPAVDDLWNEFLAECLNPAPSSKHEDDDETDPEYNVAADPDAHDEDEDALEKSIIKISKKELNDLVTELFSIIPEVSGEECLGEDLPNNNLEPVQTQQTEVSGHWEGKKEPLSDEEDTPRTRLSDRIIFERRNSYAGFSIGKTELEDIPSHQEHKGDTETVADASSATVANVAAATHTILVRPVNVVNIALEERVMYTELPSEDQRPPCLLSQKKTTEQVKLNNRRVEVHFSEGPCILPEQILILQQQLRQHIQLATSSFLQIFVHPVHWSLAPTFKEFLLTLTTLSKSRPNSTVAVCNLKPALDLVLTWEKCISRDTPENAEIVEFIQRDGERARRCHANNNFYIGNFHNTFMKVVANSSVFLYPYLLPPMPYRQDGVRRQSYVRSEDELIALGLDQFWSYVENNPELYPPPKRIHPRHRWGLNTTVGLVATHMFPFLNWRILQTHIQHVRRRDKDNPITKFVTTREIKPVEHKIIPYNASMTLHDHPEEEIPYVWLRYLSKTTKDKRFKTCIPGRRTVVNGQAPTGLALKVAVSHSEKAPLPTHFTKDLSYSKSRKAVATTEPTVLSPILATKVFRLEQTSNGPCLVPLTITTKTMNSVNSDNTSNTDSTQMTDATNTVNCTQTPISSTKTSSTPFLTINPIAQRNNTEIVHCKCCVLLQMIRKSCYRQSYITDYFQKGAKRKKFCYCNDIRHPKITNRLRILVAMHKDPWMYGMETLRSRLMEAEKEARLDILQKNRVKIKEPLKEDKPFSFNDLVFVLNFRSKLAAKLGESTNRLQKKINSLFVNFDLDTGDPACLAEFLYNACKDDKIEIFHEFMGFLTAEQAARCGKFTDYFVQTCLVDLVKTIEDQIPENERREAVLRQLNKEITHADHSACEICTALLPTLIKYPELALHVFSLFPHMVSKDNDRNVSNVISVRVTNDNQNEVKEQNETQVSQLDASFEHNEDQLETQEEKNNKTLVKNQRVQVNRLSTTQIEKRKKMLLKRQSRTQVKRVTRTYERKMIRAQVKKVKQIESRNEDMEQQKEDQINKHNEEKTEKYEKINQQNKIPVRDLKIEQVVQQNEEWTEQQNIKHAENQYKEQIELQTKELMNVQNENQMKVQYEERIEVVNVVSQAPLVDYEADHSSSGEDANDAESLHVRDGTETVTESNEDQSKSLITAPDPSIPTEPDAPMITIIKTESQDYSENSDESMVIASEEESAISDPAWSRDEDKIILELLKDHLTPEERMDKTIFDILEEESVFETLSDTLLHKTLEDIKERVVYLLKMLLLSKT